MLSDTEEVADRKIHLMQQALAERGIRSSVEPANADEFPFLGFVLDLHRGLCAP